MAHPSGSHVLLVLLCQSTIDTQFFLLLVNITSFEETMTLSFQAQLPRNL